MASRSFSGHRGPSLLRTLSVPGAPVRPTELVANAGSAPGQVRLRHPQDQVHDLAVQPGPPGALGPTSAGPESPQPVAMPPDHRGWLDDGQGFPPSRPAAGQQDPQSPVPPPQARAPLAEGSGEDSDLLPESQVLERELVTRLERRPRRSEDGPQQNPHARNVPAALSPAQALSARMRFSASTAVDRVCSQAGGRRYPSPGRRKVAIAARRGRPLGQRGSLSPPGGGTSRRPRERFRQRRGSLPRGSDDFSPGALKKAGAHGPSRFAGRWAWRVIFARAGGRRRAERGWRESRAAKATGEEVAVITRPL